MNALDLFSGAGGLSEGARLSGISTILAFEKDADASRTFKRNFPEANVVSRDVRSISDSEISAFKTDIILAGPPCQSFSTSNQKTRHDSNPLNDLLFEPVRFAKLIRPRLVVIENVHGLAIGTRRFYLDSLMSALSSIGYYPQLLVVSGKDVGLPQNRTRLFVIGSTSSTSPLRLTPASHQPTVADAIGDLPQLSNGAAEDILSYRETARSTYATLLRGGLDSCSGHLVTNNAHHILARYSHIPEGGNWRDIPASMMSTYADRSRCHTGIYHRLSWSKPAKVIGNFRKNMLVHPHQHRGLSVREAARLQSFPDNFIFTGSIGKQQQQVGNAVPPFMAAAVLKHLRYE